MTPIIGSRGKSVLQLRRSRLLTFSVLALAVGSAGCSGARQGGAAHSGDADSGSSALQTAISNEELQILGTHVSPTVAAEFTADGKWVVVAGADGVTIHDAVSTQCVHWLNGQLVEVSPDGASLLFKHPNGSAELRSIPDGKLIWRLPDDLQAWQMHFSDDGQYIVCGSRDLLRIGTREVVYRTPKGHDFDTVHGGDDLRDPADRLQHKDAGQSPAKRSMLPYIYRTTLRHDARPLITLRSGLCSPAGRFMILQTGEQDSSLEPYYSIINRETGARLLSDVPSAKALFFHNDDYVWHAGRVYRTGDGKLVYSLPEGVTAVALNADETMLAVGWRSGHVAVLDPLSGKELFRLAVEDRIDSRQRQSGHVVSLGFSKDSKRLAAVGRKLTLIDIPSQTISDSLHLGAGSRRVGEPETTSPADIVFNADGSLLLLTIRQGEEYIYSRARACVLPSADLRQRRHLCSPDYFDRLGMLLPVYFNSDATWAIVPNAGRGQRGDQLQLWNTGGDQPLADIPPQAFQWNYRREYVVPDFPKRHLGFGRFRNWYADELVIHPGAIDAMGSSGAMPVPDGARQWLATFVHVNPCNTSWCTNGGRLDFPERQWVLSFRNNRIHRLYDLSTEEVHPPHSTPPTAPQARELDATNVPETCWGMSTSGIAFSPDGSRLLVYRHSYKPGNELLALFEMPSGKLIRSYEGHAHIDRIHIAPNNRLAAISTAFYNKTWLIDLETGATLVELTKGGKCVFSPDSRYAQVGDRYGDSRSLLTIENGDLVGFEWAKGWSFSPNSRFAVGGSGRSWFWLDLASGEKTELAGEIHPAGIRKPMTTKLDLPYQGRRLLCVDRGDTSLFDVNTAGSLARFKPVEIARERGTGRGKTPASHGPVSASGYVYTPDDRHFVYVIGGSDVKEDSPGDRSRRVSATEPTEHSTQVLIGDLETGRQIRCSAPNWSRSPLQHRFFTPEGTHLITISSDKMVCWRLQPLELAWETVLSDRWTDPQTGGSLAREMTLGWSLDYAVHPSDRSILIAADGREAILFSLATGKEERRFGPLPLNSVVRFGADGAYLQVGFRANRSMKLFDASSGELIKTCHFANGGTELQRFDHDGGTP